MSSIVVGARISARGEDFLITDVKENYLRKEKSLIYVAQQEQ